MQNKCVKVLLCLIIFYEIGDKREDASRNGKRSAPAHLDTFIAQTKIWNPLYYPLYICMCCAGISKLVVAGRIGEAIEVTRALYPGLLDRDHDLLFLLKYRQFIEMVNGTDGEARTLPI